MSDQENRKHKLYAFATIGARTERGGCVFSGSEIRIGGLPLACVGDIVTYDDGSQAAIVDGAGSLSVIHGKPAALVGRSLSNGDRIVCTLWTGRGIFVGEGEPIDGLFDADYVPPPSEPSARFAAQGATTSRGGVLKEATDTYEVPDVPQRAARIGDVIEYADSKSARIITGIGMSGNPAIAYAVVGSLLDNGDVINDSPHRDVRTSTVCPRGRTRCRTDVPIRRQSSCVQSQWFATHWTAAEKSATTNRHTGRGNAHSSS